MVLDQDVVKCVQAQGQVTGVFGFGIVAQLVAQCVGNVIVATVHIALML